MRRLFAIMLCCMFVSSAQAQGWFSLFVPTEQEDVVRMLRLAAVRDNDVVFDLGSGDGRIVMEAARRNPTVRGRGIEIDEKLVIKSRAAAEVEGLADRVQFVHQNAFDSDLAEATVITMWLFPELMRMLRPKILAEAKPGTRIIARTWDLGTWKPDASDLEGSHVFKWIVPARVEGQWMWDLPFAKGSRTYSAVLEQNFQNAEGVVRVGNRRGILEHMTLRGREISFTLAMLVEGVGTVTHKFKGEVNGEEIAGTVSVIHEPNDKPVSLPWRAKRVPKSPYFAPTGVGVK